MTCGIGVVACLGDISHDWDRGFALSSSLLS